MRRPTAAQVALLDRLVSGPKHLHGPEFRVAAALRRRGWAVPSIPSPQTATGMFELTLEGRSIQSKLAAGKPLRPPGRQYFGVRLTPGAARALNRGAIIHGTQAQAVAVALRAQYPDPKAKPRRYSS